MRQKLLSCIESYRPWAVEIMRTLTAIPALGPSNQGQGEMSKALFLSQVLTELGLNIEWANAPDARVPDQVRPNILAWLPGGPGAGAFVLTHMDVVPVGSLELWSSDPWQLRVEGSRLYGRGAADNHDAMVASLLAMRALAEIKPALPGRAGVALVSDEETGSHFGLAHVLEACPNFFTRNDIIVVPDWGEPDGGLIEVAEKSILWLKVEVTGRQAHASMPQLGRNALYAAARMMVAVHTVRDSFTERDQLFTPPVTTMEPTRKEAGVENINTIPGHDVFYIDCRVLPGVALDEVQARLEAAFSPIARELEVTFSISREQALTAPPGTSVEAPVVRALKGAIKQVRGIEARVGGIGGGTVAAFFRARGIAAAVWNTNHARAHMPDEWSDLNDIIKDAQVLALLQAGLYE